MFTEFPIIFSTTNKMLYLDIIPSELILELSLFLNYRDTILISKTLQVNRAELPIFWLNKIRKELGYSNEFIQENVYDNGVMKTLLPLNEKYLELKARHSVDFGTERFCDMISLCERAARLKDFKFATELIHYLLNINQLIDSIAEWSILPYIIMGAMSVDNFGLVDETIVLNRKRHLIKHRLKNR